MNLLYPALRVTSRTDGEWRVEFDGDSWGRTGRSAAGVMKNETFHRGRYWTLEHDTRPCGLQL